ncbi:hypothetical protein IMZ48_39160 [Candidatus Bathyarchaeota archaeon]|nr:hypothetical protein [Candidatus Bathyarchaeota archaeon]
MATFTWLTKPRSPHGQYVPPRTGWNQNQTGRHSPSVPSPLAIGRSTPAADRNSPENGRTAYYDDVDSQYTADPRARSPQWGGFPGGRPTPQNSSPDLRGRGGLSPPPARGGGYNAF